MSSAVLAVMLVVACEPDLVHCSPVTHWARTWRTVDACHRDEPLVAEQVRLGLDEPRVVMTKCRLFLDDGRELRDTLTAANQPPGW